MLPKLELAPMRMYLVILKKILRPSTTPCSSTCRLFSSKMMSADSLATSTAESTEMPTSAARRAGASLMPSPMNPTTWPRARSAATMDSFCMGSSLANTWQLSTASDSSAGLMAATMSPVMMWSPASKRTSRQILAVMTALSPVTILGWMPWASMVARASAAVSLGGSRKAR